MTSTPKRPRDPNQRAKLIVEIATGEVEDENPDEGKDPEAIERGKRGGKTGGPARAASMSAERRREIARKAAEARWNKPEN